MVSPGREFTQPGLSSSDKRTRKPNSVLCGHSSRRRVAADVHQRPTRRFRQLLEPSCRIGPMRSRRLVLGPGFPPYLVLLRVGFTLPQPLLAARCALTAPFHPYHHCVGQPFGKASVGYPRDLLQRAAPRSGAVCSLWHWPSTGLDARVPDVIRHTALRSSDFPLPETPACARISSSDRPVLLPVGSLPRKTNNQRESF